MEVRIGNVTLASQAILGPMAGVSDLPFRLLCKEQGAALVCMEMISAKAITFHNHKTAELMETRPEEAPVSLQLFGHEPEVIGEAVQMIEDRPHDLLDINMGCPVPKVVNNHEGSALMKDPALIEQIVREAVRYAKRPVTVKLRTGWDHDHINVVECALAAQEGGASAVAVHGRTRSQMYSGKADWSIIAQVVGALQIPVIGNGDVTDGPSAKAMLDQTHCAAVMVGRGAEGNPWIFREINAYLDEGRILPRPSRREVIRMVMRHADMMQQIKGDRIGIQEMKKHVGWYLQGFPGASKLRMEVNTVDSFDGLRAILKREFPQACG